MIREENLTSRMHLDAWFVPDFRGGCVAEIRGARCMRPRNRRFDKKIFRTVWTRFGHESCFTAWIESYVTDPSVQNGLLSSTPQIELSPKDSHQALEWLAFGSRKASSSRWVTRRCSPYCASVSAKFAPSLLLEYSRRRC